MSCHGPRTDAARQARPGVRRAARGSGPWCADLIGFSNAGIRLGDVWTESRKTGFFAGGDPAAKAQRYMDYPKISGPARERPLA